MICNVYDKSSICNENNFEKLPMSLVVIPRIAEVNSHGKMMMIVNYTTSIISNLHASNMAAVFSNCTQLESLKHLHWYFNSLLLKQTTWRPHCCVGLKMRRWPHQGNELVLVLTAENMVMNHSFLSAARRGGWEDSLGSCNVIGLLTKWSMMTGFSNVCTMMHSEVH